MRDWNGCRFTQLLEHVGSGLERDVQDLRQMVGTYRVGPTIGQVDRLQPLVRRDVAAAENRAVRHVENLSAAVALEGAQPRCRAVQLADTTLPAIRASPAIGPN
jgi:hypothetical protein